MYFVGYLYITDLTNARKIDHINIFLLHVLLKRTQVLSFSNLHFMFTLIAFYSGYRQTNS
jgi:hypothetical protein